MAARCSMDERCKDPNTHYSDDISGRKSNEDDAELLDVELPGRKSGLSYAEIKNIFFLFGIYFVHAVPLSFSWETIPILLRQHLPYSDVATFLTSQYPYSVKVLWSPIVESVYLRFLGRRKSWMVPCFIIIGLTLWWLGLKEDELVIKIADGSSVSMVLLVLAWTLLMFMCSNIRIAADAWALDSLSQSNVHWASTAATVGEASAGFVAFNLFLGVSSFGSHGKTKTNAEEVSTSFFYKFWAVASVVLAVGLAIFRREPNDHHNQRPSMINSIRTSYLVIWKVVKLPQVLTLMTVHLASMIGFQCNDSVTVLQLVKYNFSDRDIAGLATIAFPFEVLGGIYIAKLFNNHHPLKIWRRLFPWRLLLAFISQLAVLAVAKYRDSHYRFLIPLLPFCLTKFFETTMFVALVAFHAQISDPNYGGIYLPLLATTLNMRYDWMNFLFTKTIGLLDGDEDYTKPTKLIDGYQIVNLIAVCIAVPAFIWYLRPATKRLQSIDPEQWRVSSGENSLSDGKGYMMLEMGDDSRPGSSGSGTDNSTSNSGGGGSSGSSSSRTNEET